MTSLKLACSGFGPPARQVPGVTVGFSVVPGAAQVVSVLPWSIAGVGAGAGAGAGVGA
ncbi:hypothetical protein [Rhizobacter sp. P5_C2]